MTDTGRHHDADVLNPDEMRQLLNACSRRAPTGIRDRALLVVMYRTGLRVSEALDLKPGDIDHERGTVTVLHGKGDKVRTVGIDDGALALIDAWLVTRKGLGINGRQKMFCTLAGKPLDSRQVRAMIKRRAARAGLEKRVHPHGLRDAYATELVAEGTPVNVIQKALGHSSLATTDVYLRKIAPADVIAMGRARTWEP